MAMEVVCHRYGVVHMHEVDGLRDVREMMRWDECYVEAILVDGVERWRRDPPTFRWERSRSG